MLDVDKYTFEGTVRSRSFDVPDNVEQGLQALRKQGYRIEIAYKGKGRWVAHIEDSDGETVSRVTYDTVAQWHDAALSQLHNQLCPC